MKSFFKTTKQLGSCLLALSITSSCLAQDAIRSYVNKQATVISGVDPAITDTADLTAIGNAIGDARVVMLGENDHGDAPSFLAKTRLIRYLHEHKGFNVLAFEADFFGLNYCWPQVAAGKMQVDSLIYKNVYPLWSLCDAVQQLIKKYLPAYIASGNPLKVAGIDNQMSTLRIMGKLDSFITAERLPVTLLPNYTSEILPVLTAHRANFNDSVKNKQFLEYMQVIHKELTALGDKGDFWRQTIDNLVAFDLQSVHLSQHLKSSAFRDRQMADNLKWLQEKAFPGEKIIVWAANFHISKYNGGYKEEFLNEAVTMGDAFTSPDANRLRDTYVLGFACYEGKAGRIIPSIPYTVPERKKNSLEGWLNEKGAYSFINFKTFNSEHPNYNEPFIMGGGIMGGNPYRQMAAQWNRIYDGVFFIRNMYRCQKAE